MNPITIVYNRLLARHGLQGWWPIVDPALGSGEYHLHAPRNGAEMFEICVGAILTQSVAWKNVERALANLKKRNVLYPDVIGGMEPSVLGEMIRPSGYYNQKARKLQHFTEWYRRYDFDYGALGRMEPGDLRSELLSISGIGPETADSILLYALGMRTFVIDAYTRRLFTRIGILAGNENYEEIRSLFQRDFNGSTTDYAEYHALIVAQGKSPCAQSPACETCCLRDNCEARR